MLCTGRQRLRSGKDKNLKGSVVLNKLLSALIALCMLLPGVLSAAAEDSDPARLVDLYCSQSAKDALGEDQLQTLISGILTSIEPQAVNLLAGSFPCFTEAAENDALGREIGLYIYYEKGDQDGIPEHEEVAPGAFAYVTNDNEIEGDTPVFRYMIGIDAATLSSTDDANQAVLTLDGQTLIQLDTTFCHELFHAFMFDYNRIGMTGYTDYSAYLYDTHLTNDEAFQLANETRFPNWFIEGLAGCVGNIYPADLRYFNELHKDIDSGEYLDRCTNDQVLRFYSGQGVREGTGNEIYDMEASSGENTDGHLNGSIYVSGYMACLYLADLAFQQETGTPAVVFAENGGISSISSEKLRAGISLILSRLHSGSTVDEVIDDISGGTYKNTDDFTKRFVKGTYDEGKQSYAGDEGTLSFVVGYLNYMRQLDDMDPDTHPAGSILMEDFGSTQPTPLVKGQKASSDLFRIIEKNTLIDSTVLNENVKDGGKSFSGRDSFEEVIEQFRNQ